MKQPKRSAMTTTIKTGGMDIILPVMDDLAFVPSSLKFPNGEPRFHLSFPRRLGDTDNGAKWLVLSEAKGGYERQTRNLLERILRPGDLFIDVGAHWGFFTLQAATHPAGNVAVIAFEPDPTNAGILLANIVSHGLRQTVSVVCAACGDSFDLAPLVMASSMGHSIHGVGIKGFTAGPAHWVTVVALDAALARFPLAAERRVILKIDAEGFEPRVIAGAQALLQSGRVAMIVWECGQAFADGPNRNAMLTMVSTLSDFGFHHLRENLQDADGPLLRFSAAEQYNCNIFSYHPTALPDFDKVLTVKPDDIEALNERGVLLHRQGRFEEALSTYDSALAIEPDAVETLCNRGNTMLELKRFEEALADYDKALAIKPDCVIALNNRGSLLQQLRRPDSSINADGSSCCANGAEKLRVHIINLDRSKDRLAEFKNVNRHLTEPTRFPAIEGENLDIASLASHGLVSEDILKSYTTGSVGGAMSNVALWDLANKSGQQLTICEDDAIFNRQFELHAERLIATLPPEWDLVLWGWNFDSVLSFEMLPGIASCNALFEQDRMTLNTAAFQRQILSPRAFKLIWAWGIPCYTVSAKGARTLKSKLLPFRPMAILRPDGRVGSTYPVTGIDGALNDIYRHINAFVCFPPLVITKNEHARSTIQPGGSGAAQLRADEASATLAPVPSA